MIDCSSKSEALTMLAFIFAFQSIPWTIGVPFIVVVVGGINRH
jgi:hypothetical protein